MQPINKLIKERKNMATMCVCLGMFQRGRLLEWELKLVLLNVGIINILGLLFQVELE